MRRLHPLARCQATDSLVQTMLDLRKSLQAHHEQTGRQRQITATDKQIDQLVYQLYDLTEEEIKIVEGQNKTPEKLVDKNT